MTCSGLSGSSVGGVDAERDDQRVAVAPTHSASSATAASHGSSPVPSGSGRLRVAPSPAPAPVSSAYPTTCGNQPGARVDVHRAVAHVGALPEDRGGAVALVGVDVDDADPVVAAGPQRGRGDGGVVEVAGAAEAGRRRVVARRAAERVGERLARRTTTDAACTAQSTAARAASQVPGPTSVIVS